jgi:hypothetical protein
MTGPLDRFDRMDFKKSFCQDWRTIITIIRGARKALEDLVLENQIDQIT